MRGQHEAPAAQAEFLDRLECGPYPGVVGDPGRPIRITPIERDVEIGAQEYPAADHVEVIDGHQRIGPVVQLHQESLGLWAVVVMV